MNRESARVRQHREEIGGWLRKLHDERRIVRRGNAERLRRLAPRDDIGRVHDRFQHQGVLRCRLRVDEPPECEGEILRDHRIVIGPARVLSQLERIAAAILADGPGLRRARNRAAVRRHRDESLVAVAQDRHRRFHARELRIDRIGFRSVAAPQFLRSGGRRRGFVLREMPAGPAGCRDQYRDRGAAAQVHAARARFLRCTSRIEMVAIVMPGRREAWPTVCGRDSASRSRASFESPETAA